MAAQSPTLEAKHRVEYFDLAARSFLSKCDNPRLPFKWTINPYRGCEFGCKYCYARYAHEFMELRDPLQFERKIYAKHFHAPAFLAELARLPLGETIAIGTATDPYQPAERRYRVTRQILEALTKTAGFHFGITTKSDLVARDIDVLKEVARRHYISVSMTVTTVDASLARLLEPMAPRPDLRLAAVTKLTEAGIRATVFCAPVLPLINDSEESLTRLARSARDAGALGFGANVLFLKTCSRQVFLPFLEERFPQLVDRYRERYKRVSYLSGDYPEKVHARVRAIRARFWKKKPADPPEPELWPRETQLTLF
jgi:DNA repair photolyase